MTTPRSDRVAILPWLMAAVVVAVTAVAVVARWDLLGDRPAEVVEGLLFISVGPIYSILAAVVIGNQPRNVGGWMLMLISIGIAYSVIFEVTLPSLPPDDPSGLFLVYLAFGGLSWALFILPTFHLLLTFPDGRFPTRRWKWLGVLEILLASYLAFSVVFAERLGPIDIERADWTVANPIGFLSEGDFLEGPFAAALITLALGALAAVVVRFRRSRGAERAQVKTLLLSGAVFAVVYAWIGIQTESQSSALFNAILWLAVAAMGLGIALALLRYRLYEIDRVVSRTLAYAILIALLGAVFAVGVVAIPNLVLGTGSSPPLVVAASTLAVAAMFDPLRKRVLSWVDRRFNRSRYDAERVMDGFALTLRDRVESDGLIDGWVGVVSETMQPSVVGVWVRE